jgi:thymidine phosphorylase
MLRSSNKFFVYLLATLLAVAPLQAAVNASSVDDVHAAMMAMADSEHMLAMNEMTEASSPCGQTDDCSKACAFGHSVSCIADVFTASTNPALTALGVYVAQLDIQFPTQNIIPLFRPPKA